MSLVHWILLSMSMVSLSMDNYKTYVVTTLNAGLRL